MKKNDIIQEVGWLSKIDVTWGQANSTGVPPDQKVNKAEGSSISGFGWDDSP
jgi:hypothetical protein